MLAEFFSDRNEIKKVIGKAENYTPLLAEEMKKVIADGGILRSLRDSTKNVRRLRGHNITKPLFASGALYDSIEATKNGVRFLDYGIDQARGFTPTYVPALNRDGEVYSTEKSNAEGGLALKPNKKGISVPPRNFLISVNNEKVAKRIRKRISGNLPKVIAKNMRVGIKVNTGS